MSYWLKNMKFIFENSRTFSDMKNMFRFAIAVIGCIYRKGIQDIICQK